MGKLIIDGIEVGGSSSASSVKYDNKNSTLVSTNVQGAITELNESLNNSNSNTLTYNPDTDCFGYEYDGVWYDFIAAGFIHKYLYNEGIEYKDITNGWSNVKVTGDNYYNSANVGISKEDTYIQITATSPNTTHNALANISLYTANKIDLTDYSKIYMEYYLDCNETYTNRSAGLRILSTTPSSSSPTSHVANVSIPYDSQQISLDISEITGYYHIATTLYNGSKSTYKDILQIKKIWLER